jgi:hypothetical protein
MKCILGILLAIPLTFWINTASATPLVGDSTVLDPTGQLVGTNPITGDLDTLNNTMSVDPFVFFGSQMVTTSIELLNEGTESPRVLRRPRCLSQATMADPSSW